MGACGLAGYLGRFRLTGASDQIEAGSDFSTFLGLTLSIASDLTLCLGNQAGLDHNGFEYAGRPTKSDPDPALFRCAEISPTKCIGGIDGIKEHARAL